MKKQKKIEINSNEKKSYRYLKPTSDISLELLMRGMRVEKNKRIRELKFNSKVIDGNNRHKLRQKVEECRRAA